MLTYKQVLSALVCALIFTVTLQAQNVMVFQYRHVSPENRAEFIERETKYWQKIAANAIEKGNLKFWALLEKVSVYDQPNTSNFLFINTFEDIDKAGEAWNPSEVFPKIGVDFMETNSISTTTSTLFVGPEKWVDGANTNPEEDYNYVVMNYFNPADVGDWFTMENEYFAPFIEGEMKKDATSQKGWGNARIIAPLGGGMDATTISMDMYASLHEALMPRWDENAAFPEEEIMKQWERLLTPYNRVVYRIVAVESSGE